MTDVSVTISEEPVAVSIGSGTGPAGAAGSSGVITVAAPLTNSGTSSAAILGLSVGSGLSIVSGALTAVAGGYTLPAASASVLGGVKQGANVTIDGTGIISVAAPVTWSTISGKPTFSTVATSGAYADLSGTPAAYSLPTASSVVLGGIKVGSGLSVVAGVLSATGLAIADTTGLQAALDLKAPLASPTFTGTVSGVTKTMVGLGSVDNVADASKPVSTAQAAADAAVQAHAIQRANHTGTQAVGTITGLGSLATQSGTFSGTSSGTNTGDQTITLTGDVTGSGTGSFVTSIAAGAVVTADLSDGAVTLAKTTGVQKVITYGTAAPTGGSNGDYYVKYV